MLEKEKTAKRRRKRRDRAPWSLYILRCSDGSLYTGIAKDLQRRLKMHQDGKAARYTRPRRPVQLLYQEPCRNRTHALIREYEIKTYPKKKKEKLVVGTR